ncbi:hypothetical protein [Orientia tsutsugamushi]|uniref:hypothetical protein n=1 Tax=Orientia tsutsugamushi TaxID=784 RepID=UPI000D5A4FA9|nr:IS5 family transposase ISOt6 [Orientia tsutsugamushi]
MLEKHEFHIAEGITIVIVIYNRLLSKLVKEFKIIADKYRNRRKRLTLRFNLISGIYNFELFNQFRKKSIVSDYIFLFVSMQEF